MKITDPTLQLVATIFFWVVMWWAAGRIGQHLGHYIQTKSWILPEKPKKTKEGDQ